MQIISYLAGTFFVLGAFEWIVFQIFLFKKRSRLEKDLGPMTIRGNTIHPWPLARSNYSRVTDAHLRRQLELFRWTIYGSFALAFALGGLHGWLRISSY